MNQRHYACGLLLLGSVVTAPAQSFWNYFISDAGGGNSLITWNVTGDLATPPGAVRAMPGSILALSVNAPGIYKDSYAASGTTHSIPTPDGSYFQLDETTVYIPIVSYDTYNAPNGGNDIFDLSSFLPPHQGDPGHTFLYHPGTQSALIPVDYSNFNPGTYQSQVTGFNSALTVNLTVGPVPEPSALALSAVSALGALLTLRRRVCASVCKLPAIGPAPRKPNTE